MVLILIVAFIEGVYKEYKKTKGTDERRKKENLLIKQVLYPLQ